MPVSKRTSPEAVVMNISRTYKSHCSIRRTCKLEMSAHLFVLGDVVVTCKATNCNVRCWNCSIISSAWWNIFAESKNGSTLSILTNVATKYLLYFTWVGVTRQYYERWWLQCGFSTIRPVCPIRLNYFLGTHCTQGPGSATCTTRGRWGKPWNITLLDTPQLSPWRSMVRLGFYSWLSVNSGATCNLVIVVSTECHPQKQKGPVGRAEQCMLLQVLQDVQML